MHDTLKVEGRLIEKWRFNSLIKSYLSVKTASMHIDRFSTLTIAINEMLLQAMCAQVFFNKL